MRGLVLLGDEVVACGIRESAIPGEVSAQEVEAVTERETAFPLPLENTTFTLPLSFSVSLSHHTPTHLWRSEYSWAQEVI